MSRNPNKPEVRVPGAAPVWLRRGAPLAVFALSLWVFWPTLRHAFLDWDDGRNFLQNWAYRGLDLKHLRWIFIRSFDLGNYEPLHWLAMAAIYTFWGLKPAAYHAYGILLHALTAAVLYFICKQLLRLALPDRAEASPSALRLCAAAGALFFALHPLRVEVVSWASGMHYVLLTLFLLLSTGAYLAARERAHDGPRYRRWMRLSAAAYALSLLSLPLAMAFPAGLLAVDFFPLRRFHSRPGKGGAPGPSAGNLLWGAIWEKRLHFLLAGLGAGVILAARTRGMMAPMEQFGIPERAAQFFYGLAFYLGKTVAPYRLCPFYELPAALNPFAPRFLVSAAGVAALAAALYVNRRRWPAAAAAALFYGIMVLPVLGIAQSGAQLAADRYTYVPCLGFGVIFGGGLLLLWRPGERFGGRWFAPGLFLAALIFWGLAAAARRYEAIWKDSESLWTYTLSVDSEMSFAHNQKGNALSKRGRLPEAMLHYREAIRIRPQDPNPYYNLGLGMFDQGKLQEAVELYRRALELRPGFADCHAELGVALKGLGRLDEAIAEYRAALSYEPGHAEAHNNLGVALSTRGQFGEAMAAFRAALTSNPGHLKAMTNWGNSLAGLGKLDEAVARYRDAIRLAPNFPDARNNLGDVLLRQGKREEAIAEFKEALRLYPGYPTAKANLQRAMQPAAKGGAASRAAAPESALTRHARGLALARDGKFEDALKEFEGTVKLAPDFAAAWNNFGSALTRLNRTEEAVEKFRRAIQLDAAYGEAHNNLGMALATLRKWDEAVAEFKEALRIDPRSERAKDNLERVLKITNPPQPEKK
ncbi:MAG: tetratricopeptide repeat protein [Elusimicrobia bacterium]|nr:tetratricopeptide repeat protein [Elusimicrobiota bacterium]